jgi:hypothetical protein
MLRSGLVLLLVSSVSVTLRSMGFVDWHGATFRMACSLALSASFVCFLATYCLAEFAHSKSPIRKS